MLKKRSGVDKIQKNRKMAEGAPQGSKTPNKYFFLFFYANIAIFFFFTELYLLNETGRHSWFPAIEHRRKLMKQPDTKPRGTCVRVSMRTLSLYKSCLMFMRYSVSLGISNG